MSTIEYTLEVPQRIYLAIHGSDGRVIQVLEEGFKPAGLHSIPFQLAHLEGLYLAVLKTESNLITQKLIALK